MTLRKSDDWIEQLDEAILEYLDEEGWATPKVIKYDRGIPASTGRVKQRCERLVYAGFVSPLHSDMYELPK